jgi:hypothetical protein
MTGVDPDVTRLLEEARQDIRPWSHMPVWQPPYGRTAGYQRRSAAKH